MLNLYYLRLIITKIGNKLTSFVLIFYFATQINFSLLSVSNVFILSLLPGILLNNFIKKTFNKYDKKKILIISEILSMILIVFIYLNLKNSYILFPLYFLLSIIYFSQGILDSFLFTKIISSEKEYERLSKIDTFLGVLAPLLSGITIVKIGYKGAFFVDFMSFFMSFLIYLYILKKDPSVLDDKDQEKQEIKSNNCYNFNSLKKEKYVLLIVLFLYLLIVGIGNMEDTLLYPLLLKVKNINKIQVSFLFTLFSLGMFLGTFINTKGYLERFNKIKLIIFLVFIDAITSISLALSNNYISISLFYLIQGLSVVNIIILINKIIYLKFQDNNYINFKLFFSKLKNIVSLLAFVVVNILYSKIFKENILKSFISVSSSELIIVSIVLFYYIYLGLNNKNSMKASFEKNN